MRVILVSVLFYEFRFLLLFYFGHSASRVSRYDKGHTFIFLSYLYASPISDLEVLCYYYSNMWFQPTAGYVSTDQSVTIYSMFIIHSFIPHSPVINDHSFSAFGQNNSLE